MPLTLFQTVTSSARDQGRRLFARLGAAAGRSGSMAWLLSLLLVLQIVNAAAPGHQALASPAADLSGLSAALGQPVALCHHGEPGVPSPAAPGDCGHCVLCVLLVGGVILPDGTTVRPPIPAFAAVRLPQQPIPTLKTRYAGGASPRGPPRLA